MSTTIVPQTVKSSAVNQAITGAIAGLGGGLAFGVLMGMMGVLPLVGMLVGQQSPVVGFFVHMAISALLGATFGLLASRLPAGRGVALAAGVAYGMVWWILGALVLMPLFLGMTQMILVIGGAQWASLMGHVIYGAITGLLFASLSK